MAERRVQPTNPYSQDDFAQGTWKGKTIGKRTARQWYGNFNTVLGSLLTKGDFAGARRTAKAHGLDESLLPEIPSPPKPKPKPVAKAAPKPPAPAPSPESVATPAEAAAITAASAARAEEKVELDTAEERKKKRIKNPRAFGRLSLMSGSELGIKSSLLGG